jgi:Flp pilus assembly protein CpaB
MKGIQGLTIAAGLGIVGAVCNWLYLDRLGADLEKVAFIAIADGAQVNIGDRFTENDLVSVEIPRRNVGNLEQIAPKWEARSTVIGARASKRYYGGEIVLIQDLETPARTDLNRLIGKDERVMWLPVNTSTFLPSKVNPGDEVSFVVSRATGGTPTLADDGGSTPGIDGRSSEIIGPFRILALGERMGRRELQQAAGDTLGRENVVAISVRIEGNRLEPKAERIAEILRLTNFQQVQVLLHPQREAN